MKLIIIGLLVIFTPRLIRKAMSKIFWFFRFLWAGRKDDFVQVKKEWIIK